MSPRHLITRAAPLPYPLSPPPIAVRGKALWPSRRLPFGDRLSWTESQSVSAVRLRSLTRAASL